LAGVQETGLKTRPRNKEDKIKERRVRTPEIKAQETKLKRSRSESKSWIRRSKRRR
jgi:hypothetical protein